MIIENEKYIIENYHKEITVDILNKLNISKPTLLRLIKKNNIKLKSSKIYNFQMIC